MDTPLRKILHIDMDAFYASVEQRDDPRLRGRPVAVGGGQGRGVVAAASYEARRHGVRSAMPGREARRRCPELVFVPPDFERYKAASREIFEIFREVTPLVEGLSLDEAYLDVTENVWKEPSATRVAERIKARIRVQVGLTASAGVAPSKSVAKIASAMEKPDGLTVVPPDRVLSFLQPLPVDRLWGVGPVTLGRLQALDLHTIGDLATTPESVIAEALGNTGRHLWALANGRDPRRVTPRRPRKSVSAERTFSDDTTDLQQLEQVIAMQAERVCAVARSSGRKARTITLKVRYSDFITVTRSRTIPRATFDPTLVGRAAGRLLRDTDAGRRPVRLVGVGLSGFTDADQQQLHLPFPADVGPSAETGASAGDPSADETP